jgi:hypothetical protein
VSFGLLALINPGFTLVRVRFNWGFYGDTPVTTDMEQAAQNLIVMGLCTTVGNGTETPPDPRTTPGDVAPPTQRWLWWEGRGLIPTAIDRSSGVVTWADTGPSEPCDAKGQVAASGLPGGDTLNLWASWAQAYAWDAAGNADVWIGASILINPTV